MALINCPECNKQVSDKAETCPHCGFRLKEKEPEKPNLYSRTASRIVLAEYRRRYIAGIVGGILLIFFGVILLIIGIVFGIEHPEITQLFIYSFLLIPAGIGSIIYSAHRLNNY